MNISSSISKLNDLLPLIFILALGFSVSVFADEQTDRTEKDISQNQTVWTPELQMRVKRIFNLKVSPSGKRVVFDVGQANFEEDRWEFHTHLASTSETDIGFPLPQQLKGFHDAYWGSNDSKIFVRGRDDTKGERIFILDLSDNTRRALTPQDTSVGWYKPSPDGNWLAYTIQRDGAWRLSIVGVKSGQLKTWNNKGSINKFSWSPESNRIVAAFVPEGSMDWRQKSLWIMDLESTRDSRLETGIGAAWSPVFGPSGQQVAYVASNGRANWMRDFCLRVLDLKSGAVRTLGKTPDENMDLLDWSSDKRSLIAFEYHGSDRRILSIPVDGGTPNYLGPKGKSFGATDFHKSKVVFASETWDQPSEVFVADFENFKPRKLTQVQREFRASIGRTEMIRWKSIDGAEVEGALTYPVNYQAGTKVPLLVRLHGGPPFPAAKSYLGATYMTAYPLASFASNGFAVLQPNFRGSAGYGKKFRHELHKNWGKKDYEDVISGVDMLVAKGIANPDCVGIMGWSYGGYLTSWTITQNKRFGAASMGAAMTELISFDKETSLKGMLPDWFGGTRIEREGNYQMRSPLTFALDVKCPLLIQHGSNDPVVPFNQAKLFLDSIKKTGIQHKLSVFNGGHGPRKPSDELSVLKQNLDWFKRHLKTNQ